MIKTSQLSRSQVCMYLLLIQSIILFFCLYYESSINLCKSTIDKIILNKSPSCCGHWNASPLSTYRVKSSFKPRKKDRPPSGFLVYSKECQIRDINPYDPTVKQLIVTYETLNCSKYYIPITYTIGNQLILRSSLFDQLYKIDHKKVKCCYKSFYRPFEADNDDEIRYHNTCVEFTDKVIVKEEFIMVECSLNGIVIYNNFHSFIHDKPWVEMRNKRTEKFLRKRNLYSVMIIGVDSVSRLNMHRQFPKTMNYLKNKMNAIEMFGYNKVGDNTFPNLVPLLSGFHEKELNFCRKDDRDVMDKCPLLWNKFQEFGYRTFYAEDTPYISTFNYIKSGFLKQPTDYYFRPFILAAENAIGHKKVINCYQCVGPISQTEAVLSWLESFAKNFNDRPYFSFVWINSLTHDSLNSGSLGDSFYAAFFEKLHSADDLKNTIVIFMSDHGMRWGSIRDTYIGRLEERLPVLLISFPPSFREKYSNSVENVKINAFRLTTPFDLYATLNSILDMEKNDYYTENWFVPKEISSKYTKRAQSLFTVVAKNRSCNEASIEEHWCTCHQLQKISVRDKKVIRIADYLLAVLNSKLRNYVECAKLIKDRITDARLKLPGKHLLKSKEYEIFDYTLTVKTMPGNGLFEGTVRFIPQKNVYKLLGDISRLNLYGNQSYCIQNANLRKYCYCK